MLPHGRSAEYYDKWHRHFRHLMSFNYSIDGIKEPMSDSELSSYPMHYHCALCHDNEEDAKKCPMCDYGKVRHE